MSAKGLFVDIIFDGPPGFVRTEDSEGEVVKVGQWIDRGDGTWALRIEAPTMAVLTAVPRGDGLEDHLAEMFGDGVDPGPPEVVQMFLRELDDRGFEIMPKVPRPVQ